MFFRKQWKYRRALAYSQDHLQLYHLPCVHIWVLWWLFTSFWLRLYVSFIWLRHSPFFYTHVWTKRSLWKFLKDAVDEALLCGVSCVTVIWCSHSRKSISVVHNSQRNCIEHSSGDETRCKNFEQCLGLSASFLPGCQMTQHIESTCRYI